MKPFHGVLVSVFLLLSLSAVFAAGPSSLKDLSDLPEIEKALTFGIGDFGDHKQSIARELKAIRSTLERTPASQRADTLRKLADKTKWGTPERATAYYVCAWYDVNYERCRDYLLNCFFWGERKHDRKYPDQEWPFCWAEDTVLHLYTLYERNHDFRLLHDLVTGYSDGAGTEAIVHVRVDALAKHPRGMLRVAGMSGRGRSVALECLAHRLSETDVHVDMFATAYAIFPVYLRRVASDDNDPLSKLALGLLREAMGK